MVEACTTERAPTAPLVPRGRVDLASLQPGIILITSGTNSCTVSVPPPNGRVESAGEGAENAARKLLNTPALGNPQLEAGVGVIGFALAPIAAAYGAISSSQQRLPPDRILETQTELEEAMTASAQPKILLEKVSEIAQQKTRRLLVCTCSTSNAPTSDAQVSAVLELGVDHVRLALARHSQSQYVLSMKVSARLVRTSDGSALLERSYEYESGPAFFVDWARYRGLESVAQTGYQILAEKIAQDIFQPPAEPPLLIGPERRRAIGKSGTPASRKRVVRLGGGRPPEASAPRARFQFVSLVQEELSSMEIHSSGVDQRLSIQNAGSESAASAANTDTEWAIDGLANDRNSVVQGLSCLAAVPFGLWEQTIGAFFTHSREKKEQLASKLNLVTAQSHFERDVADEVARHLQSRVADRVRRVEEPLTFAISSQAETNDVRSARAGATNKCKTALEIQVVSTKLLGKRHNSRSRALSVEIQATIFRTSDGQELYSCPIRYRSSDKKLKDWAALDGKLFRQELDACSRQAAQALASDLMARGFVTPLPESDSTVSK